MASGRPPGATELDGPRPAATRRTLNPDVEARTAWAETASTGRRVRLPKFVHGVLGVLVLPGLALATPQGQKVAEISTVAPASSSYILEATLPVPPGTYVPGQATMPLAIESGGQAVATQVEVVSRYPDAADGADVVELIARVDRPSGAQPGDEISFDVVTATHTPGAFDERPVVTDLFDSVDGVSILTRDLFGNVYSANLLERVTASHSTVEMVRDGELVRETRSHEVMLPSSFSGTGSSAPYPHLLGVHVLHDAVLR